VFLEEFEPDGTRVQSLALPARTASGVNALIASGTATVDGWLTRSADGTCLVVPGYNKNAGDAGTLTTSSVPRVVARVLASGAIDTSTALTDASVGSNFRGAASSDCNHVWVSGTGTNGGVRHTTIGRTTSDDVSGTSFANTRAVVVAGAQLYVGASVTALRTVASVGTGLPATGPATVKALTGLPLPAAGGQPYAFFFAQLDPNVTAPDTLYVADESFGVQKFSLSGGTWVARGTSGSGADVYRGITGIVSGSTVTLYATRRAGTATNGTGGGELVSIVDASGAGGTLTAAPTLIAAAAANTDYRGVALAPVAPPPPQFRVTPSASANGTITPATVQSVPQGTTAALDVVPAHGFGASVGGSCGGALVGTRYTTAPITADCTVEASFTPLPRYTVTPSAGPNGSISPASVASVISGDSATFTITPAPGYNAAVRGTCGGAFSGDSFTTKPVTGDCTLAVTFARKLVLFVGNSYTFGRADPVMSYNAAHVTDLTNDMWLANPTGSNEDEPHPWGGIPGIFKKMTDEAALEYDVSISARNAATLRGHYLNSNPAGWDLRGNVATQRYDIVMLQDQSDEPLPAGRGSNANLAYFNAYVDKLESWVHHGIAETYTESQLFGGSTAACQAATGASASACNTARVVSPGNPHARESAQVFLYQTWARPDMIGPNGTDADGIFYSASEGLEAMTRDLHDAYFNRAVANGHIEDVAPVGDAFLRAVKEGIAMRDPYVPEAGKLDLWYIDFFHPSKYGSYLSAAVHFQTLTGINALTLGADEAAARDLGIAPKDALALQRIAQLTVNPDTTPPVSTGNASATPNANGWYREPVWIVLRATDPAPNASGVDVIRYTLSGAVNDSGTFGPNGTYSIDADGVTTFTWYAVDRAGNAEAPHTLTISIDRAPPVISGLPTSCNVWPPNGKMVTVATVSASDSASGIASLTVNGASSEAPSSRGQADVQVTGTGIAPRIVSVRGDRDPNGSGRTYTITASATDLAGNAAAAVGTCTVPHDQGQ